MRTHRLAIPRSGLTGLEILARARNKGWIDSSLQVQHRAPGCTRVWFPGELWAVRVHDTSDGSEYDAARIALVDDGREPQDEDRLDTSFRWRPARRRVRTEA
jgi:hypothetical protein